MTTRHACRAGGCDRPARTDGLCRLHWDRKRRGAPIEDPTPLTAPEHGTWGEITVLPDGRLLCHECGRGWVNLGGHVVRSHGMTAREYKIAYGLPVTKGLISAVLADTRRAQIAENPAMDHLPPVGAAVGSQDWSVHRQSARVRDQHPTGTATAARKALARPVVRVCPDCGAQWCPMPGSVKRRTGAQGCDSDGCPSSHRTKRALLSGPERAVRDRRILELAAAGVPRRQIAERFGLTPEAVGKIIRG